MKLLSRRAPRRPAPPSEPVYTPVEWVDPDELRLPLWRRVLSAVELVMMVVLLGVMVTIGIGLVLLMAFFLVDFLVG